MEKNIVGKRIEIIDFWRGIAIMLVIATHSAHHNISKDIGNKIIDNAIYSFHHGVTLFFIISGLTIFLTYKNKYINEKYGKIKFIISRVFRIYPLYLIGIIFYSCFYFNRSLLEYGVFLNIVLSNWLNDNFNSTIVPGGWSISSEFYFYLFSIILLPILSSSKRILFSIYISIIGSKVIIYTLTNFFLLNISPNYNPISQLPVFLLGFFFASYFILNDKNINAKDFIPAIVILYLDQLNDFIIYPWVEYSLIIFLFLFVTYHTKFNKNYLFTFIGKIGKISYSMYLIHFYILFNLHKFDVFNYFDSELINYFLRYFVTLTLSVLIGFISFNLIENPFIQLSKKINSRF